MTEQTLAQDPAELFDVLLADGTPTGQTKPRAQVHRDGDWHRAVHVWVTGLAEGIPFLLMQRRNSHKDTWPNRLDATVGGHYRAGESLAETLRETEEEIGVAVSLSELRPLGSRIAVSERPTGTKDRELQDVFLLQLDEPLTTLKPNPAELSSLLQLPIADVLDLFAGDRATIEVRSLDASTGEVTTETITRDDFIPTIDRYVFRVAIAAQSFLQGARHIAV